MIYSGRILTTGAAGEYHRVAQATHLDKIYQRHLTILTV